jgi:hypothetical protein
MTPTERSIRASKRARNQNPPAATLQGASQSTSNTIPETLPQGRHAVSNSLSEIGNESRPQGCLL